MSDTEVTSGLVDAALEISARRRETLSRLREALERGDDRAALSLAKQLCGVDDEPKSDRTDQGVH